MYFPSPACQAIVLLAACCCPATAVQAQVFIPPGQPAPLRPVPQSSREEQTVVDAAVVLKEIMAVPAQQIPAHLLSDAYGIAIVPGVVKGSFVVGVRHGRGVVLTRDGAGNWQAPIFVSLTGGSLGWQVGLQSTDVILVFKSPKSIEGLMNGKLTIGVDAAAAAGPVGRNAAAATDTRLQAEILSYSRSRGLFAGVSIDGSSIQVDRPAGASYYRQFQVGADGQMVQTAGVVPASAVQLVTLLTAYTGGEVPAQGNPPGAAVPRDLSDGLGVDLGEPSSLPQAGVAATPRPAYANASLSAAAAAVDQSHARLNAMLDAQWQQYLALPAGLAQGTAGDPKALQQILSRYDAVAADARYQALTSRTEFTSAHRALRDYVALEAKAASVIELPPPPGQ